MTRVVYDTLATHYDSAMRPLERWFLGHLRRRAMAELPAGGRILEIGAGTGLNFVCYPPDSSGVATELSSGMLQIAKYKRRPEALQLVQNRAEELPFKDDTFACAFATLVFCSVESPEKAFGELRRVVKSGGAVVLLEHVRPGGVLGIVFDLLNLITEPLFEDHFNRRTADVASACGLQLGRVEKRFFGILNLIICRV